SPVATHAPGVVAYSAPLAPVRVLPARYSFYQPAVVAPVYGSQVYASPVYSSSYYRGPSGRRVYNYTDYGPFTYPYAYGSHYSSRGFFRYERPGRGKRRGPPGREARSAPPLAAGLVRVGGPGSALAHLPQDEANASAGPWGPDVEAPAAGQRR